MATTKTKPATTKVIPAESVQRAVAAPGQFAIALPGSVMERLAAKAKDEAAKERPSVSKISLQGGEMSYGGNPMPNNEMEAVVVGSFAINTYYSGPYDPDNIVNPDCFALGEADEDLEAHANVPDEKVPGDSRICSECPMGQWETDPRPGSRGKACKEKRRLVLAPVGEDTDYSKCELAVLDVPVTSVKNWGTFVNGLAASANIPPHACVTLIKLNRHKKYQYTLEFTGLRGLDTEEQLLAVEARRDEAKRIACTPYEANQEEAEPEPAPAPAPRGRAAAPAPAGVKRQKF